MKDSVFFDTDVILDVALKREAHFGASAGVLSLAEYKKIHGFTSSVVIANIYYILRKIESHAHALRFIAKLRLIIKVVPVTDETVSLALDSKFKDFEDALQFYTAVENNLNCVLTRNIRDYTKSGIKVCTPDEYLAMKK